MILNEKHQVIACGQVSDPASMVRTFTLQDASQLVLLGLRLDPVESQLKPLDSCWSQVRPKVWDQKYGPRPLRVPKCLLGTLFIVKYLTRQLPMGAGYCQWGGLSYRNIYNIITEGPLVAAGEPRNHGRKARKYIRIDHQTCLWENQNSTAVLTKLFLILEEEILLRLLLINEIIVIMWDVSMLFE